MTGWPPAGGRPDMGCGGICVGGSGMGKGSMHSTARKPALTRAEAGQRVRAGRGRSLGLGRSRLELWLGRRLQHRRRFYWRRGLDCLRRGLDCLRRGLNCLRRGLDCLRRGGLDCLRRLYRLRKRCAALAGGGGLGPTRRAGLAAAFEAQPQEHARSGLGDAISDPADSRKKASRKPAAADILLPCSRLARAATLAQRFY